MNQLPLQRRIVEDPAEFNVVCRAKLNLPNQTDSNAALLPCLTHQVRRMNGAAFGTGRTIHQPLL